MPVTDSMRAWAKGWRRGLYGGQKEDGKPVAEPCPFPEDDSLHVAWEDGHRNGSKVKNILGSENCQKFAPGQR